MILDGYSTTKSPAKGLFLRKDVHGPPAEGRQSKAPAGDPYDDPVVDDVQTEGDEPSPIELSRNEALVRDYVNRIEKIAAAAKDQFEVEKGETAHLSGTDRQNANDEIQDKAINTEEYLELVSEILGELKSKFEIVDGHGGELEKTTTGWPKAWHVKTPSKDRSKFISAIRTFSDNHFRYWGKLLTPLVSSIRIQGPFKPTWSTNIPRLVLFDTEGLGHKASYNADFPEHMLPLVDAADVVLLVESAKSGMTNISLGKAIEAIANTGNSRKLAVVFTGMDLVRGANLKGRAKLDHVFGGLPWAFLAVLVFWLGLLFVTFGLLAPTNATVIGLLFACALSVAAAVFLIVDMAHPYIGIIHVSDAPLRTALGQLGQK